MSNHYRLPLAVRPPSVHIPGAANEPLDYEDSKLGGPPPASCFLKCICCIAFLLVLSFVIAVIVIAIKWQLKPPRVKADYLSLSSLKVTDDHISGEFKVEFTVKNPNKVMRFRYENASSEVLYESNVIGSGKIDGFEQGVNKETQVSSEIKCKGVPIADHKTIGDMKWHIENSRVVYFKVSFKADVVEIVNGVDPTSVTLEAKCDGLKVDISPDRTGGATPKDAGRKCEISF